VNFPKRESGSIRERQDHEGRAKPEEQKVLRVEIRGKSHSRVDHPGNHRERDCIMWDRTHHRAIKGLGEGTEIAAAAIPLASPASSWARGQVLTASGGGVQELRLGLLPRNIGSCLKPEAYTAIREEWHGNTRRL
jgi:hypothetical protein